MTYSWKCVEMTVTAYMYPPPVQTLVVQQRQTGIDDTVYTNWCWVDRKFGNVHIHIYIYISHIGMAGDVITGS